MSIGVSLWRIRAVILLASFSLAAVACLATTGCGPEEKRPEISDAGDLPDQEVMEFSLTETVGGSKSWTLFADRAEVFQDKGYTKVHGVKVLFYGPDGEVSSVLTSKRGRVDEDSRDLQAFGQVVVETSEGVLLETESLKWDNKQERIWSTEFVTLTRKREVLTGYGFDSDPELKHVEVHHDVKISVRDEPGTGSDGGQ